MANEEAIMEVATNFYYHKDVEKFLAEAKEKDVNVKIAEEKKNEFTDYVVGGLVHVIFFNKPGKTTAVTIRPII